MARKKVLVVDDEPHIVELVKVGLEDQDFEVLEAYDGEQAIEISNAYLPDLVLLDIMIPKLDGFEVCRRLKSDKKTSSIYIVMLTSLEQPAQKEKASSCGADAFLTKPFSPIKLLAEVKKRLED